MHRSGLQRVSPIVLSRADGGYPQAHTHGLSRRSRLIALVRSEFSAEPPNTSNRNNRGAVQGLFWVISAPRWSTLKLSGTSTTYLRVRCASRNCSFHRNSWSFLAA